MAGRRARTGRGWDASPPRARRSRSGRSDGSGPADGAIDDAADAKGGTAAGKSAAERAAEKDPYERAREICLRQLSVRPRTRAELGTALTQRGIEDDVAASVLDRYSEVGLIDDAAFARAWVTSRHHGRGLARRALAGELRRRGVDTEVAAEALDDIDGETEAATARMLVDRKLRSMTSVPGDVAFRRLTAMLARKGYPAGVAIGAVKDALAERSATAAFADEIDVDGLADMADQSD